jgi:hypothetical protein
MDMSWSGYGWCIVNTPLSFVLAHAHIELYIFPWEGSTTVVGKNFDI